MVRQVEISRKALKQLGKLPQHIVNNLLIWVAAVEHDGLEEVRKVPGYRDEPLKGDRAGYARILREVPMPKAKKSNAMKALEKIAGGPLTLGSAVESVRKGLSLSQVECAKQLGVSKSHLCDVEKGRKGLSPERAARWAEILGYPESVFVKLAIQAELDAAGLKYKVEIEAA